MIPNLCSVCCVAYKHAPYIEECLNSIWNNEYKNIEIIVLDDGSDDGSYEKLLELQKISPCPMHVLEHARTGKVAANFNKVFKTSHGEYIQFLAMDDMLLPTSLSSKISILQRDPACAFVANSTCILLNDDTKISGEYWPVGELEKFDIEVLLSLEQRQLHSFYIQGAVFRRDIIEKVRGFNDNMLGDDIVLRTKILLYMQKHPEITMRVLTSPGFIYRSHPQSLHTNSIRQIHLVVEYWKKFWPQLPLPPMIRQWVVYAINNTNFEEALKLFTFMPELTTSFLIDEKVRFALAYKGTQYYQAEAPKIFSAQEQARFGK